jgi:hypothetical protein
LLPARPDAEIIGITTAADEGSRCSYVKYLVRLVGRPDIPLAFGVVVSLGNYRWRPWFDKEADY